MHFPTYIMKVIRIQSNDIGILNILLILFYLHSKWFAATLIVPS